MQQIWLITGGAGFIGSSFLRLMVPRFPDIKFVLLDNLTYAGNLNNLTTIEKSPNLTFVKDDILNIQKNTYLEKTNVTEVFHFAAESHVDRSIAGSDEFIQTNVVGTHRLLEWARKKKSIQKFIHISTDEVYGDLSETDPAFVETTPINPRSPYSSSKASSDLLVLAYNHTYNLPVLITRCSNNYGPFQFPEKMIPVMIQNCLDKKPLPVYGKGLNIRDWIHVDDHNLGVLAVAQRGKTGEVYNLGGQSERRNIDVVKSIIKLTGAPESLLSFVQDRPGHDRRYAMNIEKSKRDLGWAPSVKFEEGLAATVRWYQENQAWVQSIKNSTYHNKEWLGERH